eukprot:3147767-Rhodomonas_salina.1
MAQSARGAAMSGTKRAHGSVRAWSGCLPSLPQDCSRWATRYHPTQLAVRCPALTAGMRLAGGGRRVQPEQEQR